MSHNVRVEIKHINMLPDSSGFKIIIIIKSQPIKYMQKRSSCDGRRHNETEGKTREGISPLKSVTQP